MRMFSSSGIYGRLVFLLMAVLVPGLVVQTAIHYARFTSECAREIEANRHVAQAESETFETFLHDILHQELTLGYLLTMPEKVPEERIRTVLSANLIEYPMVKSIEWIDPAGIVQASSSISLMGINLADRAYIREIMNGKEWALSNLVMGKFWKEPLFGLARGIRDETGRLAGIVIFVMEPAHIGQVFGARDLENRNVVLFDGEGNIVYSHPTGFSWERRGLMQNRPEIALALAGENVSGIYDSPDGEKSMFGFSRLKDMGWVVGVGRPEKLVLGGLVKNLVRDTGVLLAVGIAALLFALSMARTITAPVNRLRKHAQALGRGMLRGAIDVSGPPEIRDLAQSFNVMAEGILEREEALRGAHDQLEIRVQERTSELMEANTRLQLEIEERSRMEDALRESQERYRTLFQGANDAISVHDFGGRILDVNRVACERLGRSREEFRRMTIMELNTEYFAARVPQRLARVNMEGEAVYEGAHVTSGGRVIPVELSARKITYAGAPAVLSIARDITERKAAEKALNENLQFLQTLIDAIPNPIFYIDRQGIYRGCNKAYKGYLGCGEKEIVGRSVCDLFPPELARRLKEQDDELFLNPGSVQVFEARARYRDGLLRNVVVTKVPFRNADDEVSGLLGIMTDVTEFKNIHRELEAATQRAEAANRAKSEFLANMSHELRTPLNAVIGFSSLLLEGHFGDLSPVQTEHVSDIEQSAIHLLSLINDILDLARVEAGKAEIHIASMSVDNLLRAGLTMVKEKALRHGIQITMSTDGAPAFLDADERKLKQIFYNLVSNAVKFTPDMGRVDIRAFRTSGKEMLERWGILAGPPSNSPDETEFLAVSVADTGIGIAPEDLRRIFNPFEQVDSSLGRKQQGTGLGLALSLNLARLHFGAVWAESGGENRGSAFYFAVPLLTVEQWETVLKRGNEQPEEQLGGLCDPC